MKAEAQQNSTSKGKASTTKKVSKNFASLTVAEGVTRICAILLFIYIARVLGVTSLGELAFATSLISFFTFFADFGLTTLGIREIARRKEETNSYGTNILLFQLLFTLLLIIALSLLLFFMPLDYSLKVLTFFYGLGLIPVALDMSYIFQGHEKMEYVLIGKTVTQVAYFILGFALVSFFKNAIFVPIAMLISGVGGAVTTYALLKKVIKFKLKKPDLKTFKLLIVTAIPFVVSEILIQIYRNIDIVMLQFTRSTNEVGYYSLGYKIVNSVILLISLISSSFFPLISFYFKHDKVQFKRSLLLFSQITGLLSIPIATGAIIYARQLLAFLYGDQLLAGTDAFKVLLLLVIVNPFRLVIVSIIIAADKQKHYVISGVAGTIINVILNIILIPRYGMIGAGITIVVTEALVGLYLLIGCFRAFDYGLEIVKKFFVKPMIAAIIMALIAFKIPNMFVGVPLAAVVYLVLLSLIKGLPGDLQLNKYLNWPIFKRRGSSRLDQFASDSGVPTTPLASLTGILPMNRSDSRDLLISTLPTVELPAIIRLDRLDSRDFLVSTLPTVELPAIVWIEREKTQVLAVPTTPAVVLPDTPLIKSTEADHAETISERSCEPVTEQEFSPGPTYFAKALGEGNLQTPMKRQAVRLQALQSSTAQSDPSQHANRGDPADDATTDDAASNVSGKARLAQGYQSQLTGAYDDAIQEYRVIIRTAPELLDEVISHLQSLLTLTPGHSEGYRVLGDAYIQQGEYAQAIEAYNKASALAGKAEE